MKTANDLHKCHVADALVLLKCGKKREIDLVAMLEAFIHFEDVGDDLHAGMADQIVTECLRG